MARIKIKDIPKDMKISKEEMKNITGGVSTFSQVGLSNDVSNEMWKEWEVKKDHAWQNVYDHTQSLSEQVQSMSKKQCDSVESVGSNSQK